MDEARRPTRRDAATQVAFGAAYSAAALLGRAIIIDGRSLSLVWPAAGVAVLWVLWAVGRGRDAVVATALLLGVLTVGVNTATGASLPLSLVFVVTNLAQASTATALLLRAQRRGVPDDPDDPALRTGSVRGALVLALAAAAAAVVGAAAGAVGLAIVLGAGSVDLSLVLLWWGRNATGILIVAGLGRLAQERWAELRRERGDGDGDGDGDGARGGVLAWRQVLQLPVETSRTRTVETAAVLLLTGVCFALNFAPNARAYLPLFALTIWVGLRFAPLAVMAYTTASGVVAVALTLAGYGPFAAVQSLPERATDVQLFVGALTMVGLVLSGSIADQHRLVVRAERAERSASARADLYTAVAEAMDDGVVVVDTLGEIVAANTAAQRLIDAIPGRVARTGDAVVLYPDGSPVPREEFPSVQAMKVGYAAPRDMVVHEKGRRTRVLSVSATRLDVMPFGSGSGAVIVYRDVTAVRDERDELAGFAGTVAHDLRSPLAAVRGWVELSRSEAAAVAPQSDLAAWLGKAYEGTDRMSALIEDLLSHASKEGPVLTLADLDPRPLAADVVALHGVSDLVTIGSLPAVRADEVLLRQVLANLVGNALKYVEPDVVPSVRIEGREVGEEVELSVTDNGIGIDPVEREAVFERFHRSHPERTDIRGSGLGLAVCRTVVERHGGQIWVEAGPGGVGSRFVLTLPRATGTPDPAA